MFGILVLIAIYAVLGFMLAWIAAMVAKEEVAVTTGVIILVLTAVVNFAVRMIMGNAFSAGHISVLTVPLNFILLIVMINLIAKLSWKHSAIIAAIYTAILLVVGFVLALAAG